MTHPHDGNCAFDLSHERQCVVVEISGNSSERAALFVENWPTW